jgi:hypothetical protein
MTRLRIFVLWLLLSSSAGYGQAPKLAADLTPGTFKARGTLSGGLQQLTLNVTSTIKDEKGLWVITDVTETPFDRSTETVTLEKGTLILRKRVVQGEGAVNYEISGNKITGQMEAAGRQIPISVISDMPLFAEGSAGAESIALLPLTEGYSTTYYNLDLGSQRILPVHLRVAGSEKITVPAGTFDTFKVEYASESGTTQSTLWVAKDLHKPVKGMSVLHTGAILTIEVLP